MLFFTVPLEWFRKCPLQTAKRFFPHTVPKNTDGIWLLPNPPFFMRNESEQSKSYAQLIALLTDSVPLLKSKTINDIYSFSPHPYFPPPNLLFQTNADLKKKLNGRRLLPDELSFSFEEIQEHAANGWIHYTQGLVINQKGCKCNRCGNKDPQLFGKYNCFRCKQPCAYCRSCIMMGRVTACTPLITWADAPGQIAPRYSAEKHVMAWDGRLSLYQQKASDDLQRVISDYFHRKIGQKAFLIWAVCGAGKTEMLFAGIEQGLRNGLNVAIATPRTDVVLELEPRLKAAFPKTDVYALYGGAEDRFGGGELVISTTHQLLRYYKAFDLIIIDEVDAFPYSVDQKLQYAAANAAREKSLIVYVTATPNKRMMRAAECGELPHVKVTRRYHCFPLPVPRLSWVGGWQKIVLSRRIPTKLFFWMDFQLKRGKQIFLFVPNIQIISYIESTLNNKLGAMVAGVHSADEGRREKVRRFREGAIRVLVTTTIMERGVTVKGVQVAVLGAEDRIFTEAALVQIAGRAGRSPEEPDGDVVFFHNGRTKEMLKAVRHIVRMNELGEAEIKEG
ncbi:competence protein ComFA [Evansella caseinilytica]|uniref:Competence protein ComFA n=1 Tax=Evansella caseinilytica TaxID=1503961 RepID=A0A1H3S6Z4_9BACI|nr:DEAD/DEAH box helicase [Evansella caseinilytica]SDZ33281.1 competence protein ComFA [Evansella caseinilytica]